VNRTLRRCSRHANLDALIRIDPPVVRVRYEYSDPTTSRAEAQASSLAGELDWFLAGHSQYLFANDRPMPPARQSKFSNPATTPP
jgi:hypothetical protein